MPRVRALPSWFPSVARSLVISLLTVLGLATPVRAQWSERDVVQRAARLGPEAMVARARAAVADAEADSVGRYPDPSIEGVREQTFGTGGAHESSIALSVPIDLSGRRAVARALARAEAHGAAAAAASAERAAITAAVLAFYEVLFAERQLALTQEALAALDEAARVLARRAEAGAVAGYDRTRLEIEAELARSRVATAAAALEVARADLHALVAPDEPSLPELAGSLDTTQPAPLPSLVTRALDREAFAASRGALAAADDARDAAATAWIPSLAVTGGVRIEGDVDTRYGYVAGVSVDLPFFSGSRGLPARSAAARQLAAARVEAMEREVRREVRGAHARLLAARQELARFEQAVGPRVELLRRGAAAGYREGTATVVELLDAERAVTAVRLRGLELSARAKRAEVELRGAVGAW